MFLSNWEVNSKSLCEITKEVLSTGKPATDDMLMANLGLRNDAKVCGIY